MSLEGMGSDQGNHLKYYKNAENNAITVSLELTFRTIQKIFSRLMGQGFDIVDTRPVLRAKTNLCFLP